MHTKSLETLQTATEIFAFCVLDRFCHPLATPKIVIALVAKWEAGVVWEAIIVLGLLKT